MITIHAPNAEDFSTLGLGALLPTEGVIEEEAGGMYELALSQPIASDGRHLLIQNGRIIKAPAPVRETPLVQIGQTGTVTRQIYKVQTSGARLRMRAKPSTSAKIIGSYKVGTEVVRLEVSGSWAKVILKKGGATGWMWATNLTFARTETETIQGDKPGGVVEPRQTREQLFRIYNTRRNGAKKAVEVLAQHISYDLKGVIVASAYAPEGVAANEVCAQLKARGDHEHDFEIYCTATDAITADYTGRSVLECLLDPDDGVVAQVKGRIVRDNYDIFILPGDARDRGVELRYAKNLLEAELEEDAADIVTRIKPVGKDKGGKPLYITANGGYVDSAHIGEYPAIYAKEIEYDVKVGSEGIETNAQARTKLTELAQADFDAGIDLPTAKISADFVRLELTEKYKDYANEHALHLYDSAKVVDGGAGIYATLRMTGYEFDAINERYTRTDIGEILDMKPVVYGYDIARGSVSGTRIVNGTVDLGIKARDASITYAKIGTATIEQLSADSITAIRAHINDLVAGTITTDQLYANLATIALAQITTANIKNANIDWATINTLTAKIAEIANAEIGTANIDWAHIKDLVTDTAIFTEGVGGKLYISRLAVTEANMVSLTVGELVVKGNDGNFYALTVDGSGNVVPVKKEVTGDNIADGTIGGGKIIEDAITTRELNVQEIFAESLTVRNAIAASLDVDLFFARSATINKIKTMTVASVEGGSTLILNESRVSIETPTFAINVSGTNGDMTLDESGLSVAKVNSDSVAPRYTGAATLYVNKNATDAQVEAGTHFRSVKEAVDALSGKAITGNMVINITQDTYYDGDVDLYGVHGGFWITFTGNGATLARTQFLIRGCMASIYINELNLTQKNLTTHGYYIFGSQYVRINTCVITALTGASGYSAICVDRGSRAYVLYSEIYGTWEGVRVNQSTVTVYRNKGDAKNIVDGGILLSEGYQNDSGSTYAPTVRLAGQHFATAVSVDKGAAAPPTPETATATFAATTMRTISGSSEWGGSWFSPQTYSLQGYTTGGGRMYSVLWFSGLSTLAGKTILSAKLTLRRITPTGRSGAAKVIAYYGALSNSAGSGAPSSRTSIGLLGSLENPQTGTFTIPTAAIAYLAGGATSRCLAINPSDSTLWNGKDYSENHARFAGVGSAYVPELTVTYQP